MTAPETLTKTGTPRTDRTLRLANLRTHIEAEDWNAALVLDGTDVFYLTGLRSTNTALLVTRTETILLTDFRYAAEARTLGLDLRVEMVSEALYPALGRELGSLAGTGTIGYDPAAISHQSFLQLTSDLDERVMLRAAPSIVASQRMVKDAAEIAAIRQSAALLDAAYAMLESEGMVGRAERDIVWMIERFLRENGAEGMSFDAIVASGPRGAQAHHSPGSAVVSEGELVTVDIGCIFDGYCSDCTRTFATGSIDGELKMIYDTTLKSQIAGLAAVRAGAHGRDVDAAARGIIADAGYGEYFGHGLGHGVGLDIHEHPRLSRTSTDTLEAGMIVTVEPGIYLEGVGGVRIEDLVVVTNDGCELLTNYTKELVTVG